jgi:hypothetical protein
MSDFTSRMDKSSHFSLDLSRKIIDLPISASDDDLNQAELLEQISEDNMVFFENEYILFE